jgi:hypothetical protein
MLLSMFDQSKIGAMPLVIRSHKRLAEHSVQAQAFVAIHVQISLTGRPQGIL